MKKSLLIGLIFGIVYLAFEVFWTALGGSGAAMTGLPYAALVGKSSLYMFPLGAAIGIILGLFNEGKKVRCTLNVFAQSLIGCLIITILELIAGLILNIWMGFNIWSYANIPLNFLAQVCLPASILWFLLNPLIFWLDDAIRCYIYKEGSLYSLLDVYKDLFRITKKTDYQK